MKRSRSSQCGRRGSTRSTEKYSAANISAAEKTPPMWPAPAWCLERSAVDVLEVHVVDARGVIANDVFARGARVGQVAGVGAQADERAVDQREQSVDLLAGLDVRADVGMERGAHAAIGKPLADAV